MKLQVNIITKRCDAYLYLTRADVKVIHNISDKILYYGPVLILDATRCVDKEYNVFLLARGFWLCGRRCWVDDRRWRDIRAAGGAGYLVDDVLQVPKLVDLEHMVT